MTRHLCFLKSWRQDAPQSLRLREPGALSRPNERALPSSPTSGAWRFPWSSSGQRALRPDVWAWQHGERPGEAGWWAEAQGSDARTSGRLATVPNTHQSFWSPQQCSRCGRAQRPQARRSPCPGKAASEEGRVLGPLSCRRTAGHMTRPSGISFFALHNLLWQRRAAWTARSSLSRLAAHEGPGARPRQPPRLPRCQPGPKPALSPVPIARLTINKRVGRDR